MYNNNRLNSNIMQFEQENKNKLEEDKDQSHYPEDASPTCRWLHKNPEFLIPKKNISNPIKSMNLGTKENDESLFINQRFLKASLKLDRNLSIFDYKSIFAIGKLSLINYF